MPTPDRPAAVLAGIPALVRRAAPLPLGIGLCADMEPRLHPAEEALLGSRTVARRRHDFALGRTAARAALADMRLAADPIGRGTRGQPIWPTGVVGAITHADALGLAVAGSDHAYAGLGLDLERLSPGLSAAAAHRVCSPEEERWTRQVPEPEATVRRTLVFSAKEAIFKATFPLCNVWLGFHDAELAWAPPSSAFHASLGVSPSPALPVGAALTVWAWQIQQYVLAFTFVPAAIGQQTA